MWTRFPSDRTKNKRPRAAGRRARQQVSSILPSALLPGSTLAPSLHIVELRISSGWLAWDVFGATSSEIRGRARVTLRLSDPAKPAYLRTPSFDLSCNVEDEPDAMSPELVGAVVDAVARHLPSNLDGLSDFARTLRWTDERLHKKLSVGTSQKIPPAPSTSIRFTNPCGLRCSFCDAHILRPPSEHPCPETQLRRVAERGASAVLLRDGEPLAHPRIVEIVAEARRLGLRVEAQSAGPPLADRAKANALARAGLSAVHVPLYAPTPDIHDELVGRRGSFEDTTAGVTWAREAGMLVRGATIVARKNIDGIVDTVRLLAKLTGVPAVRLTWMRPPAADPLRYHELAVAPSRGLPTLVDAFGPGILWRSPLLWWTPPCVTRRLGFDESPYWRSVTPLRPTFDREPHHELAPCPLSDHCAYDCRFYRVYVEAFGSEGLEPIESTRCPLALEPTEVSDVTNVWGIRTESSD